MFRKWHIKKEQWKYAYHCVCIYTNFLYASSYTWRNDVFVRLYESKDGDTYYCGSDTNPNTANYMRFTFDLKYANHRINFADREELKKLQLLYQNHLIKFENSFILNVFKDILNN